jgi:putative oxidoreductase
MRIAANIAGVLLGLVFIVLPTLIMLGVMHQPPPPAGSPAASFMAAFVPTGYFFAIQICEIVGGLLVVFPRTRNFGLLILGPIIFNILCFHICIMKGGGLLGPPLVVAVLAAFLLWAGRRSFAGLAN